MEAKIYNSKGKEAGTIALPEAIFNVKWNADLVSEVALSMAANQRAGTAHTKTRGEVAGGGRKPWKQKGTGRARHGSTRSPIWVGGGVAHGPRNDKDYSRKINKKAKAKVLAMILSAKLKDGELLFVDSISMAAPKTKEAKATLVGISAVRGFEAIATKRKNSAIIALSKKDSATERSFSNIGSILVDEARNLNPLDMLQYKYVVIENPKVAIEILNQRIAK